MLHTEGTFSTFALRSSVILALALCVAGCVTSSSSPLAEAAWRNDGERIAALLVQGENPDGRDGLGRTALMNVSGAPGRGVHIDAQGRGTISDVPGHVDLASMRLLIEHRAALDLTDDAGHTALYFAVCAGGNEAVETLLAAGADPDAGRELSPLLMAANKDDLRTIELLVAAGANVQATDQHGQTALIAAAYGGNVPVIRALLAAGAPIDATDRSGYTALTNAAHQGKLDATRFLIEAGAPLDQRSTKGETALSIAVQRGSRRGPACGRRARVGDVAMTTTAFRRGLVRVTMG